MFQKLIKRYISWLYRLLEEERKLIEFEKLRARIAERDRQAKQDAAEYLLRIKQRQDACHHTKGNRLNMHHKDFAIADHTFIDGSKKVWCTICNKEWSGKNQVEVEKMLDSTSNTKTSSEIVTVVKDQDAPKRILPFEDEKTKKLNSEKDEPFSPYMSISLWNKLTKKLKRLRSRKKK